MFEDIPASSGIYAIVNVITGHRYVGQARNMNARVRSHLRDLQKGTHATNAERRLQEAWMQFGRAAFKAVVLELVADNSKATNYHVRPDNLSLAEHYYINERSEYNVDKRIVRDEFAALVAAKAWRAWSRHDADSTGSQLAE